MVINVRFPGLISAHMVGQRIDRAFDKKCLTGFNILVEDSGQVVFGLVFDDPKRPPDPEILDKLLEGGQRIDLELQGRLGELGRYVAQFRGNGFPLFDAYFHKYQVDDYDNTPDKVRRN